MRSPALRYVQRNFLLIMLPLTGLVVGTAGYRIIEGMSFLDAFYMAGITISTVGYREVKELSSTGKLFTIAVIFYGLSTFLITISQLGQDLAAMARRRQKARMEEQISKMKSHYILCGYGRMGRAIADQLEHAKAPFVVVDNHADIVAALRDSGRLAIEGDATD